MKQILCILLIAITLSGFGQNNSQDRAEEAIKKHSWLKNKDSKNYRDIHMYVMKGNAVTKINRRRLQDIKDKSLKLIELTKKEVYNKTKTKTTPSHSKTHHWCGTSSIYHDFTINIWDDEPISHLKLPWTAKSISSLSCDKREQVSIKHHQFNVYEMSSNSLSRAIK